MRMTSLKDRHTQNLTLKERFLLKFIKFKQYIFTIKKIDHGTQQDIKDI